MELRGWNVIDEERAVLWREYEFAKGAYATTLVFRGTDGLVVVSPGKGLEAADYEVLSRFGEVRALVANNTFTTWDRGPGESVSPERRATRHRRRWRSFRKKAPSVSFRSLEELALPPTAKLHVLPGFNNGEVLFSVGTRQGSVWYTGDLLTNIQSARKPPLSWIFKWSDSAPGFRLFKLAVWFFVKDRRVVKERMTALLAEDPPAIIVPATRAGGDDAQPRGRDQAQLARLA